MFTSRHITSHLIISHHISSYLIGTAPTTMPEFERNYSSSTLQDCMPMFANNSTAEFLQEWSFDTGNSIGGGITTPAQNFSNAFYILAKRFYSNLVTTPLDCPAYDMNRKLIGFFGECWACVCVCERKSCGFCFLMRVSCHSCFTSF